MALFGAAFTGWCTYNYIVLFDETLTGWYTYNSMYLQLQPSQSDVLTITQYHLQQSLHADVLKLHGSISYSLNGPVYLKLLYLLCPTPVVAVGLN